MFLLDLTVLLLRQSYQARRWHIFDIWFWCRVNTLDHDHTWVNFFFNPLTWVDFISEFISSLFWQTFLFKVSRKVSLCFFEICTSDFVDLFFKDNFLELAFTTNFKSAFPQQHLSIFVQLVLKPLKNLYIAGCTAVFDFFISVFSLLVRLKPN